MDFGASWGAPGHLLGRLGASWARLGGVLGRLGRVLGAFWAALGASWGVLVASCGVCGSQKDISRLGSDFPIDVCWIFVPTSTPEIQKKTLIFHWFLKLF